VPPAREGAAEQPAADVGAILWRHQNGRKWRALPEELGPWWMAAQTFIRWSRLGVWERLLRMAQERGVDSAWPSSTAPPSAPTRRRRGGEKDPAPARTRCW
jgi:transposase